MQPFKLEPAYKDYLWGGTKLKTVFQKPAPLDIVAESWELSAHPDGDGVIAGGPCQGMRFSEFVRRCPASLGTKCAAGEFPILIKLIDAAGSLSIQVHPDDAYARRVEGEPGKTEMWYILDCEPGAFLYFGFDHEISREEMRRRIEDNTITEALHPAPVHKGDVFFISAGTIHAIGAGILLAEIQENSNTTYRVYDFGRVGADGKPRQLHVDKALEVTALKPAEKNAPGAAVLETTEAYSLERLARCEYFNVERLSLKGTYSRELDGASFLSLLCTEGEGELDCDGSLKVKKGDSVFIPAENPRFSLTGNGEYLLTTL